MVPRKLKIMPAFFSYGGNGGVACETPGNRRWWAKAVLGMSRDERIETVLDLPPFSDTPITMTRNRAVMTARLAKADLLLMVDSDMEPDLYLGADPLAKPFLSSSFDFIYRHWEKGPCVVGAPYCGPPPNPVTGGVECPYVFHWTNNESDTEHANFKLEMFTREDAAIRAGIEQVDALPTGLILFDMRMFELTEPQTTDDKPWFYYEWSDKYQQQKASTEDVTCTRDMGVACMLKYGYTGIYANWDAWAGHWKPKCVGKPRIIYGDKISSKLLNAAKEGHQSRDRIMDWGVGEDLPAGSPAMPTMPTNRVAQYAEHELPGAASISRGGQYANGQ